MFKIVASTALAIFLSAAVLYKHAEPCAVLYWIQEEGGACKYKAASKTFFSSNGDINVCVCFFFVS